MSTLWKQYQVVIVNLDPTMGSEIKKTRPCVIISPDELNRPLNTVVIAPVTSTSKAYPTRIKFDLEGQVNWIVIDQIRTIDKRRMVKAVCQLAPETIKKVKAIIRETFVDD